MWLSINPAMLVKAPHPLPPEVCNDLKMLRWSVPTVTLIEFWICCGDRIQGDKFTGLHIPLKPSFIKQARDL